MHVICGLPRSGSTLFCNVLNQNPLLDAGSTSILPMLVAQMVKEISRSLETKGDLGRDQEGTEARIERSIFAFCEAWHGNVEGRVIFDKGRGWVHQPLALRVLYPDSKIIVLVRDLREVFASIEKQHRKNPLLDEAKGPLEKSIYNRADAIFAPEGFVGSCLVGIRSLLDRRLNVHWIRYEDFAADPASEISRLYDHLRLDTFTHDFDAIENTATDTDSLYLNKFPHTGSGKVEPPKKNWSKMMSRDLGTTIMERFPWFNERFGYSL